MPKMKALNVMLHNIHWLSNAHDYVLIPYILKIWVEVEISMQGGLCPLQNTIVGHPLINNFKLP